MVAEPPVEIIVTGVEVGVGVNVSGLEPGPLIRIVLPTGGRNTAALSAAMESSVGCRKCASLYATVVEIHPDRTANLDRVGTNPIGYDLQVVDAGTGTTCGQVSIGHCEVRGDQVVSCCNAGAAPVVCSSITDQIPGIDHANQRIVTVRLGIIPQRGALQRSVPICLMVYARGLRRGAP